MSIGKKLMICVAGMLAVVLALAAEGWYSNQKLGADLKFATEVISKRAILAGQIRTEVVTLRGQQRAMIMYSFARDKKGADSNRASFRAQMQEAKAALADATLWATTEKGKALIGSLDADLEKYSAGFEQVQGIAGSGRAMAALALYRGSVSPFGEHAEAIAKEMIALQQRQLDDASDAATAQSASARWLSIIFVLLGIAAVGAVMTVVRKITAQLRDITSNLSEGAAQIATGSTQVASSSQTLAQGASEQAASLEETSASAEEVTSMTRQNASNTSQVAQLMGTVDQRIIESNASLELMIASMKQINASSDKISKIIKVIDEIAFQTNILALNAAVEAARAGEAGMGFAVVADEVRNLAQRSAQAAKDTTALIEESITTSNEGSQRLQKVAEVVGSITEAAAKVKVLVDEVNIGSQEQAKGIQEIARSLTDMDKVTQGNAAAAEESASASEEMSAQAQAMAQLVNQLREMAGASA